MSQVLGELEAFEYDVGAAFQPNPEAFVKCKFVIKEQSGELREINFTPSMKEFYDICKNFVDMNAAMESIQQ
ncbi:MAG: hypothetical protein EZS28_029146 [Streblomastix strix]|uniref:COMM domain-containing protein n=1 Tax=Streblomastix strix TaxID=222440 RepID=A0A5J4UYA0_9EUKA|nr:MAG: hypothetical protein EZS28_029146 [Streblomastix strix]